MRPADLIRRATAYLEAHGVESPRQSAEVLLMHILGTDRSGLYTRTEGLDSATARMFGRALCQRCTGTPLQHLTGEQQFLDLTLAVEPGVFVPRPETEGLVEVAIQALVGRARPVVIDVGTGTGAIALAVKRNRPDARVVATDVSDAAIALARRNADRLGLSVEILHGDLFGPIPAELRRRVDLVVSNPPYLTAEGYETLPRDVRIEPLQALVGGTDVHRRIVGEATAPDGWLRPGGWLVVEIGAEQGPEVRTLFEAALEAVLILPDLAGRDRVVRGRLPEGVAGV
jgi:release factor glutamine methyltransferase